MRILIMAVGSRGDLAPYLGLGQGLVRAGHAVTIVTHAIFADAVIDAGLGFARMAGDPRAIVSAGAGERWIRSGRNVFQLVSQLSKVMMPLIEDSFADCLEAARNADLLLASRLAVAPAQAISTKLGIPLTPALLQPAAPTYSFATVYSPVDIEMPKFMRYCSHIVGEKLYAFAYAGALKRIAGRFGLSPESRRFGIAEMTRPALLGVAKAIIGQDCYPTGNVAVTGYWFPPLPTGWTPPAGVEEFLARPGPVACIGFGSMRRSDDAARLHGLVGALRRRGWRGLVLGGWSGVIDRDLPRDLYFARELPHEWLFPRVSAVIHHGGAGTTAATLRAGTPAMITPYFADQRFWARRLHKLGLGPPPFSLTADPDSVVAAMIGAADDQATAAELERVRAAIAVENGAAQAAAAIARRYPERQV